MTDTRNPDYVLEEFLGQIKMDGRWVDYARGVEAESRKWQAADPGARRVVDWISKEVIVPAECEAFNIRKEGVCGTPLTAHDDCARAYDHREV